MALLAFNKTNSVVNIVGKTTVALPANGGVLTYGPAVNVTSELKGLTSAQYTALDVQMTQLNSLSSYVTQQVTLWNKSTA